MLLSDLIQRQGDMKNRRCIISPIFQESVTVSSVLEHMHFRKLNYFDHYQRSYTEGPAAFDVNFHSLLIEVQSMVNSQIPLSTGQPSVDVELLQNNAIYHAPNLNP